MKTIGFWRWLLWRICWVIYLFCFAIFYRQRTLDLPWPRPEGPYLLIGNHSSTFDPLMSAWPIWRPVHFMASAALFRIRGLNEFIRALGAFPKQKFVKDKGSVGKLVELYQQGEIIVMYPEGTRTWAGRQIPIRPGTGALIKRLGARVMINRNLTGWMQQPRWATYPRWVPIEVEYEGPLSFPESWSVEQINARVQELIFVDIDREPRGFCFGRRMAWGLPDFLWACPSCFEVGGLQLIPGRGNHVRCGACEATWEVDVRARLLSQTEGVPPLRVVDAGDHIEAHFGAPPVLDPALLEAEDIVRQVQGAVVRELKPGSASVERARGALVLLRDRLEVRDAQGLATWSVPFTELKAASMEVASTLNLLTQSGYLRVEPGGESTYMWCYLIREWWWRSDPERVGPVPPP